MATNKKPVGDIKKTEKTEKTEKTPARPKDESTSAHFDVKKEEKRGVVYVEIGENLQKTLDKAISAAYQADENIGETMSEMGVNIKSMVDSAVMMETAGVRK